MTSSLSALHNGGWGRYSRSLIRAVAEHADVVVLVPRDTPFDEAIADVRATLPHPAFGLRTQWATFRASLNAFRGCQIVHSLVEPLAPGAALASRWLGAKFLMTLHGTYAVPPASVFSIRRQTLAFALKTAALTTTGSRPTEQKARSRVAFGECRFIPNGVDPEVFHITSDAPRENFLLTTGRVKARKGADVVIRALGLLRDEFPALTFKIVGLADHRDYVDSLVRLARELGLAQRVEIVGSVSDEEIVRLYNSCRLFVLAARDDHGAFEGFPMVFYEANACGSPVVSTRGFGSEYAIRDGENGALVPPEDPAALAQAIKTILQDRGLEQHMRQRALEAAAAHTWEAIARRDLLPMYHDALKR